MSEEKITSIAKFHERLGKLENIGNFIYRGQTDAKWAVECSAVRRLKKHSINNIDETLINHPLIGYLEFLIAKARMRGFIPSGLSETSTDLELMAQLQHQGAATGLLDFTRQPLVALWFACNRSNEDDGVVYALSDDRTKEIDNREKLKEKIQSFYDGKELWRWEPSALGSRIVAQSSVLVFGRASISSTEMRKFIINASSKKSIITQLETVYGFNAESLFSDFPGYATANNPDKTFDLQRAIRYWQERIASTPDKYGKAKAKAYFHCGAAYSAIKNFDKAIKQYDKSIQANPHQAEAYNNRGNAKGGLKKYAEAIADISKAIELDPKDAEYYNNRGALKGDSGKYKESIADINKAIKLNPQFANAYCARGFAKKKLHDPTAKKDIEKALSLAKAQENFNIAVLAQRLLDDLKNQKIFPPKKD